MDANPPSPASPGKPPTGCFKWASITVIAVTAILTLAVMRGCGTVADAVKNVTGAIASLPSRFQSTQITQTFKERLTSLRPTHGDILEVAVAEREETVSKADMKSLFFNTVYLGTTVSEVRVPVVFRYHVKLSDEWRVGSRDRTCVVIAPVVRPSDPPAIRTDKMESNTKAGWMRFNAASNLASLQKDLTPLLAQRAGLSTRIDEVREASRKAVAEFVRNWLISEDQWKEKGFTDIVVVFADEPAAKSMERAEVQKPALNFVP